MDSYQKVLIWRDRLNAAEKASKEGSRSRAELLYRQSLEHSSKLTEQEYVTTLIHLADFYSTGQQFDKAEPLYREAINIYEKTFGTESIIGAMCLRSLGETLAALGKSAEAEVARNRAMQILGALQ